MYTSARAKCIIYELAVNYLHSAINVASNFAQAVRVLPLVKNRRAYNKFINTYGTHFTSRVTMGAKMVLRSEFSRQALTTIEKNGLDIQTGAKLSLLGLSVGTSSETATQRKQRETFESTRISHSASYLGSSPPPDGQWETWAATTGDHPYPVRYILTPITSLFTSKFFPNMSSNELDIRLTLLSLAYKIYCKSMSGCGVPPKDNIPTHLKMVNTTFVGTARVTCPSKYRLLSCGILNIRKWGDHDERRRAEPVSDTQC